MGTTSTDYPMGADYNRRRYASDPDFRNDAIQASLRYQKNLPLLDPDKAEDVKLRRAERARQRYRDDPLFRQACLARSAASRTKGCEDAIDAA